MEQETTGDVEYIHHSEKKKNFTRIDNAALCDTRLSFAARGLLAYLLSRPGHWRVAMASLLNQSPAGREAVQGMIKELERYGYLVREKVRGKGGKWAFVTEVYEQPITPTSAEKPFTGRHDNQCGKTSDGEPATVMPFTYKQQDVGTTEESTTESSNSVAGATVTHTSSLSENTKRSKARRTAIPGDFAPTPDMLTEAKVKYPNMDVDAASTGWINAMRADTGKLQTDWNQAWWNGMARNEQEGWHRLKRSSNVVPATELGPIGEYPPSKEWSWARHENGAFKKKGRDPVTGLYPWGGTDIVEDDHKDRLAMLAWNESKGIRPAGRNGT